MPLASVAALARAAWPTAKVAHVGSIAATVALAGVPAVVTVARGGTDLSMGIVLIALGAGASLAWAADDDTGESLLAMPVSAPARAALRVLTAILVAGIALTATLVVVAVGPGLPPDLADRTPEGLAAAAVALAVAFGAARRGERAVGALGAIAGLLVPAVIAGLAFKWPSSFPTFGAGDLHARWWLIALAGAVLAARSGRDPAQP